jgi:hypothetical protein
MVQFAHGLLMSEAHGLSEMFLSAASWWETWLLLVYSLSSFRKAAVPEYPKVSGLYHRAARHCYVHL